MTRPSLPLVYEYLAAAAAQRPDAVAVQDESGAWTYDELNRASLLVAHWLRANGVARGDRVVARLPNSRHAVALLYGVLRRGAIFVPLSPDLRPYLVNALVADSEPALIVHEGTDDVLESVDAGILQISVDGLFASLPNATGACWDAPLPSDTALLIYTSGSTSTPKAVVCPHAQVAFAASTIGQQLAYRPLDIVYCRMPFSFDYGLYQVFLCAIAQCGLALTGRQPEVSILKFIREYGATVLPLIPPLAQILVRLAARDSLPTRVRLVTSTGAELTAGTAEALRAALPGVRVVPMYGMTECKRISIGEPDDDLRYPGTVGAALPGTEVTIIDEAGAPVSPGSTGQIVVSGPHVMAGYWRAPEATAERYRTCPLSGETALYTGDFGTLDQLGLLTIIGRRDEIFKRRGVRTSTAEIEAAALDIPGVSEAAVTPPSASGELQMWVVAHTLSAAQVLRELAARLEAPKIPDRCTCLTDLPRTASGKTDKQRLLTDEATSTVAGQALRKV